MAVTEPTKSEIAREYTLLDQLGDAKLGVATALYKIKRLAKSSSGRDKSTWKTRQRETSELFSEVLVLVDALLFPSGDHVSPRLLDLDIALQDLAGGSNTRLLVTSDLATRLGDERTPKKEWERFRADVTAIFHFMQEHRLGRPAINRLEKELNKRFRKARGRSPMFKADTISRWPAAVRKNKAMKNYCDFSLSMMRGAVAQGRNPELVVTRALDALSYQRPAPAADGV